MNRKAQTIGLAILGAGMFLFAGIILLQFIFPEIDTFRLAMNCANPSVISAGTKLTCLVSDGVIPYVIVTIFSVGLGVITARLNLT